MGTNTPPAPLPPARAGHCAQGVDVMYFYGGQGQTGLLDDIWSFDPVIETWTQLPDCPIARAYAAMAYVEDDSKIILFGGLDPYGNATNDLCIYDLSTNTWLLVGIDDEPSNPNTQPLLLQNYPNPFNPTTIIKFSTTVSTENVELVIYNLKGQKVQTLVNETIPAGEHSVFWNGKDEYGNSVSSGLYFYKLIINNKTEAVKKCLLLK